MDRIRPTDTTEEKIENLTDPEASAIFREAFYAEAKALEKEALAYPVEVDEERKEALRRRILQSVAAEVEDRGALETESQGVPEKTEEVDTPMFEAASPAEMPERKYSMEASEEIVPEGMSEKNTAAETSKRVYSMGTSEAADSEEASAKTYPADAKRKKRRFSPLMRWAAVLALACVGVLGVSMTSQANGSGLWSSIQRLIGVETRWEQADNGEDRTYTNTEEYKAISNIEDTLGMPVPELFYIPEGMTFSDYEIFTETNRFIIVYMYKEVPIYYEGRQGGEDISEGVDWEGEGKTSHQKYGDITYSITEIDRDIDGVYYYVTWAEDNCKYLLSGMTDFGELEKILKNIKK